MERAPVASVERCRVRIPWVPFLICESFWLVPASSGWVFAMAPYSSWTRTASKFPGRDRFSICYSVYLRGVAFEIETDHHPLRYLDIQSKLSKRQIRWLEDLAEFNFKLRYVKGKVQSGC
jgi:RNase H-like domain found in reverse transcriptase